MPIAREDLHKGGRAFYRVRQGGNGAAVQSMKLLAVTVLDWNRGAAVVKFDHTGKQLTVPFNQLEPDEGWLAERDQKENAKRERITRESMVPYEPANKQPVVRLVEESKPLTASFAEMLKHKDPEPEPVSQEARDFVQRALNAQKAVDDVQSPAPEVEPTPEPEPWFEQLPPKEDNVLELFSRTPIAQRIYDLRTGKGWSQMELARRCIVTGGAVSQWEGGQTKPQSKSVAKLAKAFGVSGDVVECLAPIPEGYASRPKPAKPEQPQQLSMQQSGVYARIDVTKARPEPEMVHIPAKVEPEEAAHEIVDLPPLEATSIMPVPKAGFDMWLEMGKRMREPMRSEIAQLDAAIRPLEQRLLDLMEKKADLEEQLAALDVMFARRASKREEAAE
jgi:transcriptional regulator with XRE-family HTH domain